MNRSPSIIEHKTVRRTIMKKWLVLIVFLFAITTLMIKLGIIETQIGFKNNNLDIKYAMLLHN